MAEEPPPPPYHRPVANSASVPSRLLHVRNSFNVADAARPHLPRVPRGASVGPIHSSTPPSPPHNPQPPSQLSTAQLSTAQLSTAQLSTAQLSTAQLSAAQLSTAQLSTARLDSSDARVVQAVPPFGRPARVRAQPPTPPAILQSMVDAYQVAATGFKTPKKSSFSVSHPDIAAAVAVSDSPMSASLHSPVSPDPVSPYRGGALHLESRIGQRMLGQLSDENKKLRAQVATATAATARLAQLEAQYEAVERDYKELVRRQERREQLEAEMRSRLDDQVRGLHQNNRRLQQQLDLALLQLQAMDAQAPDNLSAVLQELRAEKAALAGLKERQDMELEAQRATLEEQRTHIHVLDKALANAQEKALRLDAQLKRKAPLMEQAESSHKLLCSLQAELRRRDEVYRNRESQLQMQIASLSLSRGGGGKGRGSWEAESELVSRLLGEVESKDARIAALGDELDLMQHRLTRVLAARDSEWESEDGETEPQRLRHLEGQLAEKDGIIRALLATKAGRPSASSRILDQTKQRLDSARRRRLRVVWRGGRGGGVDGAHGGPTGDAWEVRACCVSNIEGVADVEEA